MFVVSNVAAYLYTAEFNPRVRPVAKITTIGANFGESQAKVMEFVCDLIDITGNGDWALNYDGNVAVELGGWIRLLKE